MAHTAPIPFSDPRPQSRAEMVASILFAFEQNDNQMDAQLDIFADLSPAEALRQRDLVNEELTRLRKQTDYLIAKHDAEYPSDWRTRLRSGAAVSFVCVLVVVSFIATGLGLYDMAHYCATHFHHPLSAFARASHTFAATSAVLVMMLGSAFSLRS